MCKFQLRCGDSSQSIFLRPWGSCNDERGFTMEIPIIRYVGDSSQTWVRSSQRFLHMPGFDVQIHVGDVQIHVGEIPLPSKHPPSSRKLSKKVFFKTLRLTQHQSKNTEARSSIGKNRGNSKCYVEVSS